MLFTSMMLLSRLFISRSFVANSKLPALHCPSRLFATSEANHQLFIGNIPLSCSENQFRTVLAGNSVSEFNALRFVVDRKGNFRGFGYLDFHTRASATKALEQLSGVKVDDRLLKTDLSSGVASPHKGRRTNRVHPDYEVFIGNLPFKLSAEYIEELIRAEVGPEPPIRVKLHGDEFRSSGYCHVAFGSEEVMNVVLEKLNGSEVKGRTINVERAVPSSSSKKDAYAHDDGNDEYDSNSNSDSRYQPAQRRSSSDRSDNYQQKQQPRRESNSRSPSFGGRDSQQHERGAGGRGGGHPRAGADYRKGPYGDSNRKRYYSPAGTATGGDSSDN